jgi:polyhydroxyalkanoate depolymerase
MMVYEAYEARRAALAPMHSMAAMGSRLLRRLPEPWANMASVRAGRAVSETVAAWNLTHRRPPFGIQSVLVDGHPIDVREETVTATAFSSLLHFAKDGHPDQPRVLVVPGLAGHFATLVRGTIRTLLPDHDVFVADWHNARDVPAGAGRFGLDEYIEHVIDFLAEIGPGAHLLAVCQPCVAAVAAASLMAEDRHPAEPAGIILLAGPVDARVNAGRVNVFAEKHSLASLERRAVHTVPRPHRGAGRRVYPGFLQISGHGHGSGSAPHRLRRASPRPRAWQGGRRGADEGVLRGVLGGP